MKTCKEVFEFKASQMNNTITGPHQTDTMDESELHIKFLITLWLNFQCLFIYFHLYFGRDS